MRIALCNEVLAPMPFAAQCDYAAKLGYDGVELAPYTIRADAPHRMTADERAAARRAAADAGIAITGLHWLLVAPPGLSITSPDAALRMRTVEVMKALVELCADLGGRYLVHGSHHQRRIPPDESRETALARAAECFAAAADRAHEVGVTYCVEPLAPSETELINTIGEAAQLVQAIGNPALRTMLDTCAAARAEVEPIPALIRRWLPTGLVAHVQLNDSNRRGPGQGLDRFAPVIAALRAAGYRETVAIEPFDYVPDGLATAARAIGYVRGLLEGLDG